MYKKTYLALHNTLAVTLLELLAVMTIITVLAGIGFPIYTEYLTTSRRNEAISNLLLAQQKIEQHILTNGTPPASYNYTAPMKWYTISYTVNGLNYKLIATAQGKQATNDSSCQTIWVSNQVNSPMPTSCR